MHSRAPLRILALCASLGLAGIPIHAQTIRTWSASPTNGDWNTPANWAGAAIPVNGDRAAFGASTTTTLNNNISGLTLTTTSTTAADSAILFSAGAAAYTINGNALTLHSTLTSGGGKLIRNDSTATQTFGTNLTLTTTAGQAAEIITSGNLVFDGTVAVTTASDLSMAIGTSTSRNVTFNAPVTLSPSNLKGMGFGGGFTNPGGVYTFNSTITKNSSNAVNIGGTSGTLNLNAATDLGTSSAKTLLLLQSSATAPTHSTVNMNDAGAFDELTQVDVFQTAAGATNGSTGTASLLAGANGWTSGANIRIGTNSQIGASFVVGGKTGLGSNGTATYNGNITALDSNNDQARTVTVTAAEGRVNFTGVISTASGGGTVLSVTKTGAGIVALSGANTYTGSTLVSAGTLLLNNTSGSATGSTGTLTVNAGTLAGFGSTGSVATIGSGARLTAGNIASGASVPTLDAIVQANNTLSFTQSLTINGSYDWYLGAASETAGFSQLDISSGSLTLGGASSFTLTAANFLSGLDPNSGNPFWSSDHIWNIGDVSGALAISGAFGSVDLGLWSSGSFSLSQSGGSGNDLTLAWTAVPEPSATVLIAIGLYCGLFGVRRRAQPGLRK